MRLLPTFVALIAWSSAGISHAEERARPVLEYATGTDAGFRSPCRAGTFDPEKGPNSVELYDGCLFASGEQGVNLEEEFQQMLQRATFTGTVDQGGSICEAGIERGINHGVLFDTLGACGTPESGELDLITFNLDRDSVVRCEAAE